MTLLKDFRGPLADGVPDTATRIEQPRLERFGLAEGTHAVTILAASSPGLVPREVGRVPGVADLDPELINNVTWRIPNALVLIGSRAGDQRNAMTASWVSQVAMEPVLIGVSVQADAVTNRLISEGGTFTVNLWDAANSRAMVKYAKPADVVDGAIKGRAVRDAPGGAPIFDEAIAWLDCAVRHTLEMGSHVFFVGEVTALDLHDEDATVASMFDTRMKYGGVARR